METLIEEILFKLHHLPEEKVLEVLDFVELLTLTKPQSTTQLADHLAAEAFEVMADQLANEFSAIVGSSVPALSEFAVSRAGIYQEHP